MSPKRHPSPFYHRLDKPLIKIGGKDRLTLRSATEGTLILGGTGSGKTSGSGEAIRRAYLRSGMGGLVLCVKADEADSWRIAAKKMGRAKDLLVVDASGKHRFNFMDYAAATIASNGFHQNLVVLMQQISEATMVANSGDSNGENSFFEKAALKWLAHTFPLLHAARETIQLKQVYQMVVSAPKSLEDVDSEAWRAKSFCWKVLRDVALKAEEQKDQYADKIIEEHGHFWLTEYPSLNARTRTSVEATLTNLIHPFLSGKLAELFCTHSTVVPEMAREGQLILLDLPALTYGPMGAAAQSLFKYLFGMAMQRQKVIEKTRPVFVWIDECQYFLSRSDAELLSTARSSKISCVFITQDLPSFYAQLGPKSRDVADSIISKFGTRILHANTCRTTNQYAAEIIGKTTKFNTSKTTNTGRNSGGSLNQNEFSGSAGAGDGRNQGRTDGISTYQDFVIPPEYFAKELRTGGPKNKKRVDAILVRNGGVFKRTGAHWLKAEFKQT